jgi:hypothetical protein
MSPPELEARELELAALVQALADGRLEPATIQRLLTAAVRAYAQRSAVDSSLSPFLREDAPTETEVAITASAMLEAAGIEVFELGLWRAWGGAGGGEHA